MRRALVLLALFVAIAVFGLWASTPLGWRAGLTLLPGQERHDLEALDSAFRACLSLLLEDLRAAGHRPVVRATWRDATRQEQYHRFGGSQRKTGSLHQRDGADGAPAALAADVADLWPLFHFSGHASFYLALREAAPARGLVTGGSWKRTDPRWARYDLGWDPGHVEPASAACGGR